MARLTRLSMALISTVALAAPSFAADTGMLYVKSNPSGATVVIAGKERGKTPVLVKGLPAGELTVELRVAGVKPVTKEVTVRANKVSTIDVTIDVPGATLTVVSDPLEATVFLDNREVGKTPLTLEHLDPGEHRIMLLKGGYPRTARSVVLEAGAEQVLDVKLGTGGGEQASDKTELPAPGVAPAAPRASEPIPVEVQLIFKMLKDAAVKGSYARTRRNLETALRQPDMADFKDELRGAISVTRALEDRQDAMRRAVEALVGKDVTLKTKKAPRKGRVEGASVEGITIASKLMVAGRAVGESRSVIKWSDLAPEERRRLGESWKPEGPDGAVAWALVAVARRERAAAARAIAAAGKHPLGKYLDRRGTGPIDEAAEQAAREVWEPLARRAGASRIPLAAGRSLLRQISEFKERHGESAFARQLGERLAETKMKALQAMAKGAGVPADAVTFRGHYYKLYKQVASWTSAKVSCERLRGHLVTITSREENQFVLNMCRGKTQIIWIGFTDSRREGLWQWVTGEKVSFTAWGPGQPDNRQGEDCGLMRFGFPNQSHRDGEWNDINFVKRAFFVCEWDIAEEAAAASPSTGAWPRE